MRFESVSREGVCHEHEQESMACLIGTFLRCCPKTAVPSAVEHTPTQNVDALKNRTGKANAKILFDSTVDEFTDNSLFKKVKGKANIALVGFTRKGDVFGGVYTVDVRERDTFYDDSPLFIFSF